MELDQLKSAWNSYTSSDADKHRIDETELRRMLKRRTNGLMDRIDRNVRGGFVVILALVLFFVVDDFYLTPSMEEKVEVPLWVYLMDALNTLFLFGTFLYFWLQYRNVKANYSQNSDMKRVLSSSIQLLTTYRRLFYWALCGFLLVIAISSMAGFFANPNVHSEEFLAERNHLVVFGSFAVLLGVLGLIFVVFHWGFRRLYGRYIKQLKETLTELDEIE